MSIYQVPINNLNLFDSRLIYCKKNLENIYYRKKYIPTQNIKIRKTYFFRIKYSY